MTRSESQAHTFIVRMHRERRETPEGEAEWRGEVVHVPSRRAESFRGLGRVPEVIERLLEGSESG